MPKRMICVNLLGSKDYFQIFSPFEVFYSKSFSVNFGKTFWLKIPFSFTWFNDQTSMIFYVKWLQFGTPYYT